MRLVDKNSPKEPYRVIGELSPADSNLLRSWWTGERGKDSDLRHRIGQMLSRVAEKKAWIACDCLDRPGTPAPNPPVLFPREKDGVHTIQRGATEGRAEHAESCPFRWEEGTLGGRHMDGSLPRAPATRRPTDFILYKRSDHIAAEPTPGAGGQQRGQSSGSDALQQRLFAIMERAEINRFDGRVAADGDDRTRIRAVAKEQLLYDEVDLEDILWTSPKWFSEGWAAKKLIHLRTHSGWPGNVPLQGFFLLSAKDVDGTKVICDGGVTLELERLVNVYADSTPARTPYVVMISAKFDEKTKTLRLIRGYAHPRYADSTAYKWSLCPVDSDYERKALGALLYVVRKTAEQGAKIELEKPLFDLVPAGQSMGCRPDFLVHARGKTLCIETMGSNDPEYRARKVGIHAIMRQIGPVIEDERVAVEDGKANKILIAKVFGALREIGVPDSDR